MSTSTDNRDLEILAADVAEYVSERVPNGTPVELGTAFCRWCLDAMFDLPLASLDKVILDGPNDNGIDAIFDFHGVLTVVQTKYNASHSYKDMNQFAADASRIKQGNVVGTRPEIIDAVKRVHYYIQNKKPVQFFYITNSTITNSDLDRTAAARSAEDLRFLDIKAVYGFLDAKIRSVPKELEGLEFDLNAESVMKFGNTYTAVVNVRELHRLIEQSGTALFEQNIRQYLGTTRTNKDMKGTLLNAPKRFLQYNNGVTMVCSHVTHVKGATMLTLRTPQIVNGCQTAYTIHQFIRAEQPKNMDACILVRVYEEQDAQERQLITRFTNSQNTIKRRNFLALEDLVKRLQQRLTKYGAYLEAQRGAFALLGEDRRQKYQGNYAFEYLYTPHKKGFRIEADQALQGYVAAFLQDPVLAFGQAQKFMPGGPAWSKFDDAPREAEYYLFPFMVYQNTQKKFGFGPTSEQGYKRSGRWFFVCAYFRLLWRWYLQAGLPVDSQSQGPRQMKLDFLKSLFKNADANEAFLQAANDVLEAYFDDETIGQCVGSNYNGFFKGGFFAWSQPGSLTPLEVLDRKIEKRLKAFTASEALKQVAASV